MLDATWGEVFEIPRSLRADLQGYCTSKDPDEDEDDDPDNCPESSESPGHGERSRSQLLLKLAGAEIMPILAVNVLAVNGALHALYSVKKCLIHSI